MGKKKWASGYLSVSGRPAGIFLVIKREARILASGDKQKGKEAIWQAGGQGRIVPRVT